MLGKYKFTSPGISKLSFACELGYQKYLLFKLNKTLKIQGELSFYGVQITA